MATVTEHRRDQALSFLATTDEECARAKALMIGLEKQEKTILGQEILAETGKGNTVAEKEAKARTSPAYEEWNARYEAAVVDYEILRNKRHTEELVFECWRTEQANRRMGGSL